MRISYKRALFFSAISLLIAACSAEVGSEEWCEVLLDKPKIEWTAEEVKGFANYCIGRSLD